MESIGYLFDPVSSYFDLYCFCDDFGFGDVLS